MIDKNKKIIIKEMKKKLGWGEFYIVRWLNSPNYYFNWQRPMELIDKGDIIPILSLIKNL